MAKRKHPPASALTQASELKIIGGRFRGRKLRYEPFQIDDAAVTRPMKHRVREAIFNLVGVEVEGKHAIDLFAGTGALGLEALSRGAAHATLIERHVPTARVIEENVATLDVANQCTLLTMSAFLWAKRDIGNAELGIRNAESPTLVANPSIPHSEFRTPDSLRPWLVFCSPPFDFFVDRLEEMRDLVDRIITAAPEGSVVVVEADERLDFATLSAQGDQPGGSPWDIRTYRPALVGVWRKPSAD